MNLQIEYLPQPLGAVIQGWVPNQVLDAESIDFILQALRRRLVLIFRDHPTPSDDALIAFGRQFGTLGQASRHFSIDSGVPEIMRVVNDPDASEGVAGGGARELPWHTDYMFQEKFGLVTFLEAQEVPASGGGVTAYCDTYAALETLDPALRIRLQGLRARHQPHGYDLDPKADNTLPSAVHPVIQIHPDTGRAALYVSPDVTRQILDIDPAESDRLINELVEHTLRPEFVYHHHWRAGDLVMSDQVGTMHRRESFDPHEARRLRQLTALAPV